MFVVCVLAGRERKIHSTHAQKVELSNSFFFMTERHFFLLAPRVQKHTKNNVFGVRSLGELSDGAENDALLGTSRELGIRRRGTFCLDFHEHPL